MCTKKKTVASKIMIIRHAEKPNGYYRGISEKGMIEPVSLVVKGWQRAGALAGLFNPKSKALKKSKLSVPDVLYASPAGIHSKSKRPVQTIKPLSRVLKIPINRKYGRDDYGAMIDHALQQKGIILICWQHQHIPQIASRILANNGAPKSWPSNRFDLVWVFDLDPTTGMYRFSQHAQNLLPGDKKKPKSII
jgi:hypothetical protein